MEIKAYLIELLHYTYSVLKPRCNGIGYSKGYHTKNRIHYIHTTYTKNPAVAYTLYSENPAVAWCPLGALEALEVGWRWLEQDVEQDRVFDDSVPSVHATIPTLH